MTKIKKNIIYRILIFILGFLIVVPIITYFVIQTTYVQNFLTKKFAEYFSKKFDTEVSVGSVDFRFFNAFILNNFYIEDQQEDTLAYVASLQLNITNLNISESKFDVSKIYIDSLKCFLKSDTLQNTNYDFILEAFDNEKEAKESGDSSVHFSLKKIEITNSKFYYKVGNDSNIESQINFDDLYVYDFNFFADDLIYTDNSIEIFIEDMNFKEKSGFEIVTFSTGIISNTNELSAKSLYFETNESEFISDHLSLNFDSYDSFDDIFNQVFFDIQIEPDTKISTEDLAYFVPQLSDINQSIYFSGKFLGALSDLKVENLDLKYGADTKLLTNFEITGLPEIENIYFDFKIDTLTTSNRDIATLKNSKTGKLLFEVPEIVAKLGTINYNAHISGMLKKFAVSGNLTTDLGQIVTNINITDDSDWKYIKIEGLIAADSLNAGVLLDNDQFGKLTFTNLVELTINDFENIDGKTITSVEQAFFNGYNYQNINIDGKFTNKSFNGVIDINDPNLITHFTGFVNFEKEKPTFDFNLNLERANLFPLNIEDNDSSSFISTEIIASFVGKSLDDLNGEIKFARPLVYQKNMKIYEILNFNIKSYITEFIAGKEKKAFYITSDFFNGKIDGIFEFSTLMTSLTSLVTDYIPSLSPKTKIKNIIVDPLNYSVGSNFNFNFILNDSKMLTELFMPSLKIADSTSICGKYRDNPLSKYLKISINTNFVEVNDIRIENIKIEANTKDDKSIKTSISCNNIFVSDKIGIDTFLIETSARNDSLRLKIAWQNSTKNINKGELNSTSVFSRDTSNIKMLVDTEFEKDTFYINNSQWVINNFSASVDELGFVINNLDIINKVESIRIGSSGRISKNPDDEILVNLLNFDLSSLNGLLDNLKLEGRVLSNIKIKDVMGDPIINSYNTIQSFKINDVKLGRLIATSEWIPEDSKIKVRVFTERFTNEELVDINTDTIETNFEMQSNNVEDSIKYINISGDYYVDTKMLDFNLDFYRLKLSTFSPYLEDVIDGISSNSVLYGNIKVNGSTSDPQIEGKVTLKGTAFKVIYTDVFYTVSKDLNVNFNNKEIVIQNTKINLSKGNGYANFSGTISHNMFSDINLDLNISTNNFMFLNTIKTDTSNFYGKVYASGDINISGKPNKLVLTAEIKTEKDTEIHYQLNSEKEVDVQNSFITFVKTEDETDSEVVDKETDYYGFTMDLILNITPETKLQMIMDEATGDEINIQGVGTLHLKMNTIGDLNLFGTIILEKGDYMFTMKNIIKKKFEIQKGGSLNWNGEPANATVDIGAVYKIKGVELYDLVLEDDFRDVKVPVECYLNISEDLQAPNVTFNLNLPKANERIVSQLNNLDAENLNKQVISLLILGRFQPLPGLTQDEDPTDAAGVINTSEVLTNQLNHWLSKISDDFDFGVNWETGDAVTSDEVGMAISTQLWDDRITINGNVGVGGDSKNATTNTSNIVGDLDAEIKLNKKGNLKFKAFYESNDDNVYEREKGLYTQGIGIFYKKEFDKWNKTEYSIYTDTSKIFKIDTINNKK